MGDKKVQQNCRYFENWPHHRIRYRNCSKIIYGNEIFLSDWDQAWEPDAKFC